jgi:hypothetical protein
MHLTESNAREAIKEIDAALTSITKRAYRIHYVTLEVMIARYQRQMRLCVQSYVPTLIANQGSKAMLKIKLMHLGQDLNRICEPTLTAAANVGFARCLNDLQIHGFVRKISQPVVAPPSLSMVAIAENKKYIEKSLIPAMLKQLAAVKTADEMPQAIAAFESRINLYGHWVWKTAERAYLLGLKEFEAKRASARVRN